MITGHRQAGITKAISNEVAFVLSSFLRKQESGSLYLRSTQKITELVPGKKGVWHVSDSSLNFIKDKTEWNGTDIVFDIARKDDKTELCFTHVGLVPGLQCYGDCSEAWGFYLKDSLRNLITAGKGEPNRKKKDIGKKAA